MLLKGTATHGTWAGFTTGQPLYLSTTSGEIDDSPPSAQGDIVRIVGYSIEGGTRVIYFNPSTDWVELA